MLASCRRFSSFARPEPELDNAPRRTKDALAAAKARGVRLGGVRAKGLELQREAAERAERLRQVFGELATLSARSAAQELNRRKIPAPAGGKWFAVQVIRVRKRLEKQTNPELKSRR